MIKRTDRLLLLLRPNKILIFVIFCSLFYSGKIIRNEKRNFTGYFALEKCNIVASSCESRIRHLRAIPLLIKDFDVDNTLVSYRNGTFVIDPEKFESAGIFPFEYIETIKTQKDTNIIKDCRLKKFPKKQRKSIEWNYEFFYIEGVIGAPNIHKVEIPNNGCSGSNYLFEEIEVFPILKIDTVKSVDFNDFFNR